jgi:alpha-tubulin suppressor-like RCC1 family protein
LERKYNFLKGVKGIDAKILEEVVQ